MKEFNSFMDIYPGCIGMTTNEKGQKVPIYEINLSNDVKTELQTANNVLNFLNGSII